jgi:hypothetical protein
MSQGAGARALQRVDEYEERFVSKPRLELVPDPPPVRATATPSRAPGERRTVRINGRPTPPRPRRTASASRAASSPDRMALYALLLGLFLIFMAIVTANA